MNFSRRKLAQPAPPLPAAISITTSSTNFMAFACDCEGACSAVKAHITEQCDAETKTKKPRRAGASSATSARLERSGRVHRHGLTALRALDGKRDAAVDQREQRVVLAGAHVGTGVKLGAA